MTGRVKGSLTPHRPGPPLLEVDPPDAWRARFAARTTGTPCYGELSPCIPGPHVHDRNGTAHPIRTQETPK